MSKDTLDDETIIEILEPGSDKEQSDQEQRIRRKFWPTFQKAFAQLPFAEDIVTAYYCALDEKTPAHAKGILLAALAYFVLPIDIVPDFIVTIGFGDDIAILTAAIATLRNHMTEDQRKAARKSIADMLSDDQMKS